MTEDYQEDLPGAIAVSPMAYRTTQSSRFIWQKLIFRVLMISGISVILLTLGAGVGYTFLAQPVVLNFEPAPDELTLHGGVWHPKIGGNFLLLPGRYEIKAKKSGYESFTETIKVQRGETTEFRFNLTPFPGLLSVEGINSETKQPLTGGKIKIDGRSVGKLPLNRLEIVAGSHQLQIIIPRYLALETTIDIAGKNLEQRLTLEMQRAWSVVQIPQGPEQARVIVDGIDSGFIPTDFEHDAGTCRVVVEKDGYKPWSTEFELMPGETKVLPKIELEPAAGGVAVRTDPDGALIQVNSEFNGLSPTFIHVSPNTPHEINVLKPGFQPATQRITVASNQTEHIDLKLIPIIGIVELDVVPSDSEIFVDGLLQNKPGPFSMTAIQHSIIVRRAGYQEVKRSVIANADYPLYLRIKLTPKSSVVSQLPEEVATKDGYRLKLIRPEESFFLGSGKQELNRRSNESLRKIKLERPFMIGIHEVTNSDFSQFNQSYDSTRGLNGDNQPVVNVSWDEAALYCNWLSKKEDLPPAYSKRDGKIVAATPMNTGYRLPSEAEWAYCLKSVSTTAGPYYWGTDWPPKEKQGNVADKSADHLGIRTVADYDDGYIQTAPVATFKADGNGLFDMVGNVAEWCHDYYGIYNYKPNDIVLDPLGPEYGIHHVVRGSSWRHGTSTQLRLAYRDYSNDKRDDIGFRVCRYVIPIEPDSSE